MPKIASHALRHLDFATLVVEVGRRVSGIERYAVMGDFAHDAANDGMHGDLSDFEIPGFSDTAEVKKALSYLKELGVRVEQGTPA